MKTASNGYTILVVVLMACLASCGAPSDSGPTPADREQSPSSTERRTTPPLPDFSSIDHVPALKRTFYDYFHPLVMAENDRIRRQRRRLNSVRQHLLDNKPLAAADRTWLVELAATYELPREEQDLTRDLVDSLLVRVDIVPVRLAIAQAAIESGWGRSRFARRGNNIFGQWCWTPGCGIVPGDRADGAVHELADFDTPALSIRSYINNLNTHPAYADWRRLRRRQRGTGSLDAQELARELTAYSTLREEYVRRLRAVMRQNEHLLPGD